MKLASGEKKWLAFSVVVIALPLSVGLFLHHINATPVVGIPAPPAAPKPNGYDLYVAAATAMTRATPPVDPVNDTKRIDDPKVRAQRYSLARKTAWLQQNQNALALFDQALQTPTLAPTARSFKTTFPSYAKLRQMARNKTVQSNALWMSGDYYGALQSGLDTVQMGHDMRRGGGILGNLVGIAIGDIGRSATGDTVERIDASQAKLAARRLEKLLDKRWNLDQALTSQKQSDQTSLLEVFGEKNWRASFFGAGLTPLKRLQIQTVSKQQILDNVGAIYDRQIANARLPYIQKSAPPVTFKDPFSALFSSDTDRARIVQARDLIGDRALMLQLALRAYRLENGVYPPNLNALTPNYLNAIPADPFGGGEAMHYTLNGKNYVLWSIGPDGVDDGGKPIPSNKKPFVPAPGERSFGPKAFTDFESKGDVVASVNSE